jgi:hypothetical protein
MPRPQLGTEDGQFGRRPSHNLRTPIHPLVVDGDTLPGVPLRTFPAATATPVRSTGHLPTTETLIRA